MTGNKGIIGLLDALKIMVIDKGMRHYKLLLKGMEDLYATKSFIDSYLIQIHAPPELNNNIIFINNTMPFSTLNDLYNSIDLYVSAYIAEGFNLVPLEVLAAGTRVVLPRGGSTEEYSSLLEKYNCITFVKSILNENTGCNMYKTNDIVDAIISASNTEAFDSAAVNDCISRHLSWDASVKSLVDYFKEIIYSIGHY